MMPVFDYNGFFQQAELALSNPHAQNKQFAAIIIEFEGFTELDSKLGYQAVDRLLNEAGERLLTALHDEDLIGILGRHQLACLLQNIQSEGYAELAGHKILSLLNDPFSDGLRELFISPVLGISLSTPQLPDIHTVCRQANSALRQSWRENSAMTIYTPAADELIMLELDLLADFKHAIDESRIFLMYQPQISLHTGKFECAEALLRWTHPKRGVIMPAIMVQVAERTALISKLTYWVINTAIRQCAEYQRAGHAIGISINISAHNLREPDLADVVLQAITLWNLPAELVVIEITETAIMTNQKQSMNAISRFKDMGVRIAIDDFGTGYSSMELLGKLPIDEIKIDISFIKDMLQHTGQECIVRAIIDLAHHLDMRVIAEGVEDEATYEQLRLFGCDLIQGYFVSRACLLPDLMTLLRSK